MVHRRGTTANFAHVIGAPDATAITGIVTPDIATDGLRTDRYTRTTKGDTVFCPITATEYNWREGTCLNGKTPAWVYARDMVSAGKTYVGFRIVSGSYGRAYYEIYWK